MPRKPLIPTHPDLAANAYYKRCLPLLKDLHETTLKAMQPALDWYRVSREFEVTTDAYTDSSPAFFRKAKEKFEAAIKQAEQDSKWSNKSVAKVVKPSFKDTENVVKGNLKRQKVPAPHPDPKHQAEYLQQNIELIQTIPQRSFSTLARMIDKHLEGNATVETLAKTIESRYGVTQSQAALIAKDQVQKLNSQLTHDAFVEAGVTKGIWRTSEDERVREAHQEVNGKSYDLEEGLEVDGETTFPGMPINCRCFCEPILPGAKSTKAPKETPRETPREAPEEAPVEPTATPVEQVWGEALRFTKTETPQAETIARDLQLVTEASPLLAKTLVDKGATINIDLVSKSVPEAIRYSKKLKNFYEEAGQIEGMNRVVTGMVIGEKHLVIASGGGLGTESIMAHEYGHVLDFKAGSKLLSGTDSWRKTWKEWTKRPDPGTTKWAHDYFLDPTTGPREAFAEVYAHTIAKGKANAASVWGDEIVNEMVSTLKSIDPKIKFGE